MCTRSKSGIHKPRQPYVGIAKTHSEEGELGTVEEAMQNLEWRKAMESEFHALSQMEPRLWFLFKDS